MLFKRVISGLFERKVKGEEGGRGREVNNGEVRGPPFPSPPFPSPSFPLPAHMQRWLVGGRGQGGVAVRRTPPPASPPPPPPPPQPSPWGEQGGGREGKEG